MGFNRILCTGRWRWQRAACCVLLRAGGLGTWDCRRWALLATWSVEKIRAPEEDTRAQRNPTQENWGEWHYDLLGCCGCGSLGRWGSSPPRLPTLDSRSPKRARMRDEGARKKLKSRAEVSFYMHFFILL